MDSDARKSHRKKQSGPKAGKKKNKEKHEQDLTAKQRNPKAFAVQSVKKTAKIVQRTLDIKAKKHHIPLVDRTPTEPPPVVVAIVGPPKVGKSTLLQCVVKNFTKQKLSNPQGPVTVVSGKHRRLTIVECNNDINSMIDVAKIADLVLLLVDASFGFEMEIFEFLNICQVHGFPRIMGVLTHLDSFRDNKRLKKTKKRLKHRFWTEVYQGAKLFYLSGMVNGEYQKREVHNLCRFISVMKFRPLTWRLNHPYVLADRMEDITDPGLVNRKPKSDRNVSLYGYVRGTHFKNQCDIHIPGCGDYKVHDVQYLPDPCPTPTAEKKRRSLNEKERMIYAPMSGVGGVVYDRDAVYIDLGGSHSHTKKSAESGPVNELVSGLMGLQQPVDDRMTTSSVSLFANTAPLDAQAVDDDLRWRRAVGDTRDSDSEDSDSEDGGESEDSGLEDEDVRLTSSNRLPSDEPPEKKMKMSEQKESLQFADSDDELEKEDEVQVKTQTADKKTITPKSPVCSSSNRAESSDSDGEDGGSSSNESDDETDDERADVTRKSDENLASVVVEKNNSGSSDDNSDETDIEISCSKSEDNFASSSLGKDSKSSGRTDNQDWESSDNDTKDSDSSEGVSDSESSEQTGHSKMADQSGRGLGEEEDVQADSSGCVEWKSHLVERAAEGFRLRQQERINYRKLVYGQDEESQDDGDGIDELGGLFTVLRKKSETSKASRVARDGLDCSRSQQELDVPTDLEQLLASIRDCFVTGKWDKSEDAETLLKQDDELYGDFEDLETGEVYKGDSDNDDRSQSGSGEDQEKEGADGEERVKKKAELTAAERRERKKRKLKERFDNEYDLKGDEEFYEGWRSEVEGQAKLNREEFESLPEELRVQYEGFRPGMYVRVEIRSVPCEFVTNFDASYPVILGGLQNVERNVGYVQVRVKKHRWHKKILKTRNPLIFSLGWRRFQSIPLYTIQDHNYRNRLLKYTPEHLHCHASFWGPITPQGTGLLAVESVSEVKPGFRIAATGVVLELDKSIPIVKKLKLTGEPMKIFKKTAFVQGMFNSKLEVAKFEGASIRTVSGVRGQIKKALSSPEGAFRATFEDRILMSDIVFVRTWFNVEVPQFYNPVTTLLLPREEKARWVGMKTVGQLRRERGLRGPLNNDSLYKPVTRISRAPTALVIPRHLQKELPFTDTPKTFTQQKTDPFKRVSVIREPREAKVAKMMQMLKTLHEHKIKKQRVAMRNRAGKHQKETERIDEKKMEKQKEVKKEIYRVLGQLEKKKNRTNRN